MNRDGLGDITNRHPELSVESPADLHPYLELSSRDGVEVTLDILRSKPSRSVTYIALGPLTNLSLIIPADSQLLTYLICLIVYMFVSLYVPVNTIPMSECKHAAY